MEQVRSGMRMNQGPKLDVMEEEWLLLKPDPEMYTPLF
jgi:hypothetical protein